MLKKEGGEASIDGNVAYLQRTYNEQYEARRPIGGCYFEYTSKCVMSQTTGAEERHALRARE